MRLRKQTGLKLTVTAGLAGLFALFFSLVRANAPAEEASAAPVRPTVEYERFFNPAVASPPAATPQPATAPRPQRQARTRAS